ncbi:MAG: aminotransferase class IV family protein [Deltaproteobacteria bacterium]|jgi:branched-subunit amino acid aminotransferase/4-amino-4-deoxychorismate lyase|nr:aminotransferase class IV family protein [Deltaproteobacteria bacterium]MBW2534567.1 aminotransferase class IV family protein [Deltaproteobacteria bacterium]
MAQVELHAVTQDGPVELPVPPDATDVHELFDPMPLGVYSGLATYDHNRFVRLDDHIARTKKSAALLRWPGAIDADWLRRTLHQLVEAFPHDDCRVRFDWLRVPLRRDGWSSRVVVGLSPRPPVPERDLRDGVHLALTSIRRRSPLIKTTDFVIERRVCAVESPDAYEHLMVDDEGRISEGTSVNFFGVRGRRVLTAGAGVLEGITRKTVLELVPAAGLDLELEGVPVAELGLLDEAFLTSSTREIVPVTSVGTQLIGNGRPGPVTLALLETYRDYVRHNARPACDLTATT